MRIPPDQLGLHLIVVPNAQSRIPTDEQNSLYDCVEKICHVSRFELVALHALSDHLHLVMRAPADSDPSLVISRIITSARNHIVARGGPFRSFGWRDDVHITLLPHWHVEILASFVRDQDRFHETRTLQNELEEIFLPNLMDPLGELGLPEDDWRIDRLN